MNKRMIMMWKMALVSAILVALFWGAWQILTGHVPVQTLQIGGFDSVVHVQMVGCALCGDLGNDSGGIIYPPEDQERPRCGHRSGRQSGRRSGLRSDRRSGRRSGIVNEMDWA